MRTCGVKIDRKARYFVTCLDKKHASINIRFYASMTPAYQYSYNSYNSVYLKHIVVDSELLKALVGSV